MEIFSPWVYFLLYSFSQHLLDDTMFLTHCLLEIERNFLPLLWKLVKVFMVLCAAQMPLRVIIPSKVRGFRF